MKKNVLVFPCGSEIGLEIHRSLKYSTHFALFGASTVDDHGKYVYESYIPGVPFVDDDRFLSELNNIIEKYGIDFIVPAHDSVVLKLAEAKATGKINVRVVTSPYKTCKIARSKSDTYRTLKNVVNVPKMFESVTNVGVKDFPVFLKPDVGQGSKGVHIANDRSSLELIVAKNPDLLILEMLPGDEYTVDCFTDRRGNLIFWEGRKRERTFGGISIGSSTVQDMDFGSMAQKINETLSFRGAWFFQVKLSKHQEPALLEIAPRIAGTSGLVRCRGVNLTLLSLFDAMDIDIEIMQQNSVISVDRALESKYKSTLHYEHVYIDFDDLVISNGKVNTQVISFLYQCINQGVSLHLITRHREDITKTLKQYKLTTVFDSLTWLKAGEHKSDYIKEKDAIFIDDSFIERKDVAENCRIPVFDAHMIESLIN